MAVAPCAMAFESDDPCPHHAPAEEHGMASHHGHDGHGEVDTRPSCATVQPECCELAAASIDTRGNTLQFKSVSDIVLITAPLTAVLPSRAAVQRHSASDPPDISGSSPPLHVLFCVYLD
ncbi:MAG: hypothetical protein KJO95_05335 [Gammaproteobacteria bacterium]|nr:hypothetical protein [Gammaproteobacteria bacterium]NNL50592.1 hypothetical protein [Woeseiaceae bacterium]